MKYIDSYKVAMITIVYDILQEGAQSIATFHGRHSGFPPASHCSVAMVMAVMVAMAMVVMVTVVAMVAMVAT